MKINLISVGILIISLFHTITCSAVVIEVVKGGKYSTIQAGLDAANIGDTVIVREGVYRESLVIGNSGSKNHPFIIKAYPGEKVILNGSEFLTGWVNCISAREVKGNPNWQHIFYAKVPENVNRININLFQGDSILTIAQFPEAKDPFYDEETSEWYPTPTESEAYTYTTLTDPLHLSRMQTENLEGSFIKIVAGNNEVYIRRIINYSSLQQKITFEPMPASIKLVPGKNRYAISNHPGLIDKPGKYYFDEELRRIYIWPYDEGSINNNITVTVRQKAFSFSGINHLIIDGFIIKRYYGKNISGNSSNDVTIKHLTMEQGIIENDGGVGPSIDMNKCTFCSVDSCIIRYNKHSRGIIFNNGSYNTVSHCTITRIGGTGVDLYREKNSQLLYNTLMDCNGQHANGLTCYLGCRNILIKGNIVLNCNTGLTYQEIDSLMVVNNIFHGGNSSSPTACWNASNSSHITFYHNTLIGSGSRHEGIYSQNGHIRQLVVKNNILDGMSRKEGADVSHNLNLFSSVNMHPLSNGDIILTSGIEQLFIDPAKYDFRLKAGSKAIDAGIDLPVMDDLYGNLRPYGTGADIGHHEWVPDTKK